MNSLSGNLGKGRKRAPTWGVKYGLIFSGFFHPIFIPFLIGDGRQVGFDIVVFFDI